MLPYIIAGIAAYIAGNYIVHDLTGKHLHEHLFDWWCELRDYFQQWLSANRHLSVCALGLTVLDAFDDVVVRTKNMTDRITLGMFGVDSKDQGYGIVTREVSVDEAVRLFPQLRQTPTLVHQLTH